VYQLFGISLTLIMLYQLPTGKVVWLEIDDVINLSKEDLQFLIAVNAGEHVHNPFKHSAINKKDSGVTEEDLVDEEEDVSNVETYYEEYFPDEFSDLLDDGISLDFED
jgi:hypothetical protein